MSTHSHYSLQDVEHYTMYKTCTHTHYKCMYTQCTLYIIMSSKYGMYIMYMLGAKHGFGQFMDVTAQSVDPCFVQQSMDCLLIPWIAQTEERKAWIRAIHR